MEELEEQMEMLSSQDFSQDEPLDTDLEERYAALRERMPGLPPSLKPFQADVLRAATDPTIPNHIFVGVPTGGGKTLLQLLLPLLSPEGTSTIIVAPLNAILQQMQGDCSRLGITCLDLSQVRPEEVKDRLATEKPSILLASVESLESDKVRKSLMNAKLAVEPHRLFVCIDEAQVCDKVFGWADFRPRYDSTTWRWIGAALRPRYLLLSGSTSESSLWRTCVTLGISRRDLLTFSASANRDNIFLMSRFVDKIDVSTQDRHLGTLRI